ncbi:putative disease resistance protein RGA3 [Apium graveolens]|uniref:putative disease resistance protein RGA3 n=1 Tax=Apium graveolens TaxID=4045 RepID=UPI003D7B2358
MGDALISQVIEQLVVGEKDIENIDEKLSFIQKLLENAERSQVRDATVRVWLENLKDVAYDMDNVICEWKTANRKMEIAKIVVVTAQKRVCLSILPFSCFNFSRVVHRCDIAITIHNINERLNEITYQGHMFSFNREAIGGEDSQVWPRSSSSIAALHVCGREDDTSTLLKNLCFESGTQAVTETIKIISIVGLGGIEKTTLAKLVYNCDEVRAHFDQLIWVCVSDPYDEVRVAKAIVESIEWSAPDVAVIDTVVSSVEKRAPHGVAELKIIVESERISGPKYWEQLECNLKKGALGSRVLVSVAGMMNSSYIHPLGKLSEENCRSLSSRIAFNGKTEDERERLEDIVLQQLGGMFAGVSSGMSGAEEDLSPPLLLSYYDLSSKLRQCFIYCAKFPKY